MPPKIYGKPAPVSRCRKPGHAPHRKGCEDCKAFSRYQRRRRTWEAENGIDRSRVPIDLVAGHVQMLMSYGNWTRDALAAESGISKSTIGALVGRRRTNSVLRDIADSLISVKPRPDIRPPMSHLAPSLECMRIARGLAAQGWTFRHMNMLYGVGGHGVHVIAADSRKWVWEDTVPRFRALAEQLRAFDIATLPTPMPGMNKRTAQLANRNGWVPLNAWYGQDITDPNAVPWKILPTGTPLVAPVTRPVGYVDQDDDDDLPEVSPWSFIDPIITLRVAEAVKVVDRTARSAGKQPDGFITPATHITRIEAHVLVENATQAGLSSTLVGALLGFSVVTKRGKQSAQRTVERMKAVMRDARATIARLAAGQRVDPSWCVGRQSTTHANATTIAIALLAVQDAPFGPGWTPTELAERAGVEEKQIREFLAYATRRGDREWVPDSQAHHPPVVTCGKDLAVVPVDLDAVLAA